MSVVGAQCIVRYGSVSAHCCVRREIEITERDASEASASKLIRLTAQIWFTFDQTLPLTAMKKLLPLALFAVVFLSLFSSCTSVHKTMREPNVLVEIDKEDFELSTQVTAEASTTYVLGIDWKRLRNKQTGEVERGAVPISLAQIPVVGSLIVDPTANYALYNLMQSSPGYDVVFYPQYETTIERPILGIGLFKKVTTVKTTARLGKLK